MSVSVSRKTAALQGWELSNQQAMVSTLTELESLGWDGAVERAGDTWTLRLSASGKQTVNASLGQWLVLDGDLKSFSEQDFDTNYSVS